MDEAKEEQFEERLDDIRRDAAENLTKTASVLAGWLAEKKYTVAEQFIIIELLRASILAGYVTAVTHQHIIKLNNPVRKSDARSLDPSLN